MTVFETCGCVAHGRHQASRHAGHFWHSATKTTGLPTVKHDEGRERKGNIGMTEGRTITPHFAGLKIMVNPVVPDGVIYLSPNDYADIVGRSSAREVFEAKAKREAFEARRARAAISKATGERE